MKTQELLDKLMQTPAAKNILAEAEQAELTARQSLVDEMAAEQKRLDNGLPDLIKKIEHAAASLKTAEAAMNIAKERLNKAKRDEHQLRAEVEGRCHRIKRQLIESAPDEIINGFLAQLDAIADQERGQDRAAPKGKTYFNSISRKLHAILVARREIEEWRWQALGESEMWNRFDRMLAALPEIIAEPVEVAA